MQASADVTALEFQKYERRARRRERAPEPAWASYGGRRRAGGSGPRLSVVIPCRDHAHRLRAMLPRVDNALNACAMLAELIVVDCASRDDSCVVIDAWRGVPGFRAIAAESGLWGVGAVTRGLAEARGDAAIVLSAEIPHTPWLIRDLVASWRADSVLAYVWRDADTGNELQMSWTRGMFEDIRSRPNKPLPPELTSLCLFDREVVDYLVYGRAAVSPSDEYYGAD